MSKRNLFGYFSIDVHDVLSSYLKWSLFGLSRVQLFIDSFNRDLIHLNIIACRCPISYWLLSYISALHPSSCITRWHYRWLFAKVIYHPERPFLFKLCVRIVRVRCLCASSGLSTYLFEKMHLFSTW
jgi:hypothetical protein